MTSRLVDRLAAVATIAIFCAAIIVLFREFANVTLREVFVHLAALPKHQIIVAVGLTIASYILLTGYDFLALHYVGRRLRFRDVLLASFTAFAFCNSIGFQLLSGGSIRYRIYSSFGLDATEIGEVVAFCTLTYALGVITVGGMVALFNTAAVGALVHLPRPIISVCGLALLGTSIAYLGLAAMWREPIEFGRYRLRPPSLKMAFAQVVLASVDAVLAGMVMYVLLPADLRVSFQSFLGVYMIAATASVLSLVPGGLGVFETVITVLMAPPSKAAALGGFLAYRMIYFIFPLALAIVLFALHEFRRRLVE